MSRAFSRSQGLFSIIANLVEALGSGTLAFQEALAGLAPYRSRGHGRGRPGKRSRGGNNGGLGRPHQGKQERLRRMIGGFRGDKRNLVRGL